MTHYDSNTDLVVGAGVQKPWPGALYAKPVVIHSHARQGSLRRSYMPDQTLDGFCGHYCGVGSTDSFGLPLSGVDLGAATTVSTQSSILNPQEIVSDIVQGVTGSVVQSVATAVDRNMDRVTSAVSNGLDRFVDSSQGKALFSKISDKSEKAILNVVSNQKTNLVLLGIAGVAFMMGSVAVGSKMSPTKTKLSFLIGATALAAVALGAGSVQQAPKAPGRIIPKF